MAKSSKQLTFLIEEVIQKRLSSSPLNIEGFNDFQQKIIVEQVRNNISSVYWNQVIWKNTPIRFPTISEHLKPLPRDWKICARYKSKLIQKYLDFCNQWQYPIIKEFDLLEKTIQNYVSKEQVRKISNSYKWCFLSGGDERIYIPNQNKIIQSYSICFTNNIDNSVPEEECVSFSAIQEFQIPILIHE